MSDQQPQQPQPRQNRRKAVLLSLGLHFMLPMITTIFVLAIFIGITKVSPLVAQIGLVVAFILFGLNFLVRSPSQKPTPEDTVSSENISKPGVDVDADTECDENCDCAPPQTIRKGDPEYDMMMLALQGNIVSATRDDSGEIRVTRVTPLDKPDDTVRSEKDSRS